jgi:hypothetical protein
MKKQFRTKKEFKEFIQKSSGSELKKYGFGIFQKYDKKDKESHYLKPGQTHYLIPGEFKSLIPSGFKLVDIFGKRISFTKRLSSDLCMGFLSYGVIK